MEVARTSLDEMEYQWTGAGPRSALLRHGGHMYAGIRLADDDILQNG